ncbi:MAG: stage V sporulation protein E [Planctomycetes bacterium]|nr:stage V sporulation protein E [Planctomycetota bacterium]
MNRAVATTADFWREAIMFATIALLGLGFVMALSLDGPVRGVVPALSARATRLLFAMAAFCIGFYLRLDRLRQWVLPLYISALFLCLVPRALGDDTNGAYRWINVGAESFQPVELLKVLVVLATAEVLVRRRALLHSFADGVLPVIAVPVSAAIVLLSQPDLGHAFFLVSVCGVLILVGGLRARHSLLLMASGALALRLALGMFGHSRSRLAEFTSGEPGFQLGRSLAAFAEGGVGGTGLGQGWMARGYLPEARNDFVLAIIGNELGIIGSVLVIGLFGVFGWAAMRIAASARCRYELLVACGLGLTIVLQACINILGVTFTIPEKGIDLPFLSSGGTNLVCALGSVGILCNIARASAGTKGDQGRAVFDQGRAEA